MYNVEPANDTDAKPLQFPGAAILMTVFLRGFSGGLSREGGNSSVKLKQSVPSVLTNASTDPIGVQHVEHLPISFVEEQLTSVLSDLKPEAVKARVVALPEAGLTFVDYFPGNVVVWRMNTFPEERIRSLQHKVIYCTAF